MLMNETQAQHLDIFEIFFFSYTAGFVNLRQAERLLYWSQRRVAAGEYITCGWGQLVEVGHA